MSIREVEFWGKLKSQRDCYLYTRRGTPDDYDCVTARFTQRSTNWRSFLSERIKEKPIETLYMSRQ